MTAKKRPTRKRPGAPKAMSRLAARVRGFKGPGLRTLLAVAGVTAGLILAVVLRPGSEPAPPSGTAPQAVALPRAPAAPPAAAAPQEPASATPLPPSLQQAEPAAPVKPAAPSPARPAARVAAVSPGVALPPKGPPPAGSPAWMRNAVPAPAPNGHPRIVIVIDDMGVDRARSSRMAALPGPLTLAWLPYARELPDQTAAARARGHELMVHVPMEPDGRDNPGPDALVTGLPAQEIRRRLSAGLDAFSGYVGINNHMGSRFTADRAGMAEVMAELGARGLLFLDSRTTPATRGPELAPRYDVPLVQRDVFLDHDMSAPAVAKALEKVEAMARRNGLAIAIGHPHDVTLAALTRWLPTLEGKGFQLVPLSSAVRVAPPARPAG